MAQTTLPTTHRPAYEVLFDHQAGVWEAYRIEHGRWTWLGAFDSVQMANHAAHKDQWGEV